MIIWINCHLGDKMTVSDLYKSSFRVNSTLWEYLMILYFFIVAVTLPIVAGITIIEFPQMSMIIIGSYKVMWDGFFLLTENVHSIKNVIFYRAAFEHLQYMVFNWPFGNLYRGEAFQLRAYRSMWWLLCVYVSRITFVLTIFIKMIVKYY